MSEQDTSEHMDNGVSVQMCPNDTREQLEADVHSVIFQWGWDSDWSRNAQRVNECVVMRWLDRQANISWNNAWKAQKDLIAEMQAKVDELTTERDLWNERTRQSHDYALELTAECDKLQEQGRRATMKVMRMEQEREQLDRKMAELADEYQEHLQQIAELKAERDELQKRNEQLEKELGNERGKQAIDQ